MNIDIIQSVAGTLLGYCAVILKIDSSPRFHVREAGDMHCLLAKAYLKTGNSAAAREELRRMAECDLTETAEFEFGRKLKTPLLSDADYAFYWNNSDFRAEFESKLLDPEFDEIRKGV